jgi:hypothetical protein
MLVDPSLRGQMSALVDDAPTVQRLSRATVAYEQTASRSLTSVLREILASDSRSLRPIAAYHARELGLPSGEVVRDAA